MTDTLAADTWIVAPADPALSAVSTHLEPVRDCSPAGIGLAAAFDNDGGISVGEPPPLQLDFAFGNRSRHRRSSTTPRWHSCSSDAIG